MAWIHGTMTVAEAISELVRCAAAIIQEASVNGEVHIEIDNDGSFQVQAPEPK